MWPADLKPGLQVRRFEVLEGVSHIASHRMVMKDRAYKTEVLPDATSLRRTSVGTASNGSHRAIPKPVQCTDRASEKADVGMANVH